MSICQICKNPSNGEVCDACYGYCSPAKCCQCGSIDLAHCDSEKFIYYCKNCIKN